MGHTSIRISVETLLRRHAFTQYTVWGGGVQRSDLSRSALRMFKGDWTARGEPSLASWDQTLNDRQATLAAELIDGLEPRLLLIAEWTAKLVALVSRECKEVGLAVYLDRISGRCCSAVTSHVRRCAEGPSEQELQAMARRVIAVTAAGLPRSSADEFESDYGQLYEVEWTNRGKLNLAAYPPSLLLLGSDHRPPLVRRDGRQDTDMCGTDRSVYSRYTSYRPSAPGTRVPFRSRSERCVQPVTLRDRARDVGEEVVRRACQPYGVGQNCHRSVLRGTYYGLTGDWQTDLPATGTNLDRRCVSLRCTDEQDVAETVRVLLRRRCARHATASHRGIDVDGQHWTVDGDGPASFVGHLDRVTQVVMRRLWKAIHGLELYVEEHMCSCALTAAVAVAVDRAVPAALARWEEPLDGQGILNPPTDQTAARFDAQDRTCELLMRQPEAAKALLLLQRGWRSAYLSLVAADPGSYLSPDEFAIWCLDMVPGARDHDRETS